MVVVYFDFLLIKVYTIFNSASIHVKSLSVVGITLLLFRFTCSQRISYERSQCCQLLCCQTVPSLIERETRV